MVSTYGAVSSHTLQWISDKGERGFRFSGNTYEPIEKVREIFDADQGLPVWISRWSRSPGYWACFGSRGEGVCYFQSQTKVGAGKRTVTRELDKFLLARLLTEQLF